MGASPLGKPTVAPTVSTTAGSATTFLPTGAYRIGYTFVTAGGESCMSAETSATTFTRGTSQPRVTLPALPSGVTSISLYLTAAGGAAGTETRFCTGITGTTIDLIGADDGSSGSYWENAQGGDGNDAVGGATAQASAATFPAVPTAAILLNGTGAILTVATGVTLTVRGDVVKAANTARVVLSAGSTFRFDASAQANSPAAGYYRMRPDTNSRTGVMLDCQGTSGSRCTVNSVTTSSAACGRIIADGMLRGAMVTATYTDFSYLGDASAVGLTPWLSSNGDTSTFDHCSFSYMGGVNFTGVAAQGVVSFTNCSWTSTTGSYSLATISSAAKTGGTRLIQYCTFDKTLQFYPATDWTIEDNYFAVAFSTTNGAWASFTRNLMRKTAANSYSLAAGISNCYHLEDHATANPNMMGIIGYDRDMTVDGCVLELTGSDANGDCLLIGNPASARTATITNNIILPNAGGNTTGTLFSALGGANATIVCNHNTHFAGSQGCAVGESYVGHAGMLSSFKSNLFWDTSARGYKLFDSGTDDSVTDLVSAASADYNAGYNISAGDGKGYNNLEFSSGSPGAHDIDDADPGFVDSTRNLAKWSAMKGSAETVAAGLALIAANPALIYDAGDSTTLIPWVRAGFAPTNVLLQNAGHDGVTIGAVEGIFGGVRVGDKTAGLYWLGERTGGLR